METKNFLNTCHAYMKAMLLPIEEIHSLTPVDRNDQTYIFHPYRFKRSDAAHYPDGGYYDFSQQYDFFSPESITYLLRYGISISIKRESVRYFQIENHIDEDLRFTKYQELTDRPHMKTIVTITIDATAFILPEYNIDGMDITDQIKLIKKIYLDYLNIHHNVNLIYRHHKPDWFDKQLVMMKEWANELIDYLKSDSDSNLSFN